MADYEVIASGSVDASAPVTINITSIPGTFKHLLFSLNSASTRNSGGYEDLLVMRFNGDTGSNYNRARQYKYDFSSGAGTQARTEGSSMGVAFVVMPTRWVGQSTKSFSHTNICIPAYSGAVLTKGVLVDNLNPYNYNFPTTGTESGIYQYIGVGGWDNTAAITSIQISTYEGLVNGTAGWGFAVNTSYVLSGLA